MHASQMVITAVVGMESTSTVFFTEALIVLIVVIASVYNLSKPDYDPIWTTLLGSCLGYMLPNPKLEKKKKI